ncbi:MAG TPA: hypothetical protein DEQ38_06595 [Elusimicrobia bacterium]|nr:MAG: hypothetical protein A2089_09060 [Elusimicrobia bacterium GWD2_63_28]HCC47771.1 hypothetical protein [Elusimicrobiota bacterium]
MISALILMLLLFPGGARADGGAHYFTAVQNGAYNFKGGRPGLEESYKALQGMVKLAGERGVRLTLLFSAQYAVYIASDSARLAELQGWNDAGHEIGAYHQGPETRGWDGYSDLAGAELARVRKSTGPLSAPGHAEFMSALALLQPAIKTGCVIGGDKKFLAAAPPYEICRRSAGSGAASGVNEAVFLAPGGGPQKSLSSFHPADKAGIEAAQQAFAGMGRGVYGAVFRSTPAEFGAFYAWLTFLGRQDPQGSRSRTVSTVLAGALLPEKKTPPRAAAVKPEKKQPLPAVKAVQAAQRQASPAEEIPKLKPVRSFFGSVGTRVPAPRQHRVVPPQKGYCGDGVCDVFERRAPGRCPRDCGQ